MSKVRMSLRSRRMVRRHREWFALMDETGLTSDQLRCALALAQLCRDLSSVGEALGVAFSMFVECMSDAEGVDADSTQCSNAHSSHARPISDTFGGAHEQDSNNQPAKA